MQVTKLLREDDAVSPVIGVILMVAVTVILAAVIGAFVLNIGGPQEAPPQNGFDFGYSNGGSLVEVTHGGGSQLDATQLTLAGPWESGSNCSVVDDSGLSAGEVIVEDTSTGTPCGHTATPGSGAELEIVWTSSSGEQSQIVAESTVP